MTTAIKTKPKIFSAGSMCIAKLCKDFAVSGFKGVTPLRLMKDVPKTLLAELSLTCSAFLHVKLLQANMFYASCQMCWLISFHVTERYKRDFLCSKMKISSFFWLVCRRQDKM